MRASSLLQLNLQKHELYIAHNPLTQDIHNTLISLTPIPILFPLCFLLSFIIWEISDQWKTLNDIPLGPIHHYNQPAKERGPITSHQVPQLAQFIRFTSVAGTSWPMVTDLTFSNVQCSPDQWLESSIFLLELLDLHVGPLALQPPKHF